MNKKKCFYCICFCIRFRAIDDKGAMARAADVIVNMCNCSGHGECVFTELREGEKASAMFRLVACNCTVGWSGEKYVWC